MLSTCCVHYFFSTPRCYGYPAKTSPPPTTLSHIHRPTHSVFIYAAQWKKVSVEKLVTEKGTHVLGVAIQLGGPGRVTISGGAPL